MIISRIITNAWVNEMKIILSNEEKKMCVDRVCLYHRAVLDNKLTHDYFKNKFKQDSMYYNYLDFVVVRLWGITLFPILHMQKNKDANEKELRKMIAHALDTHLEQFGESDESLDGCDI